MKLEEHLVSDDTEYLNQSLEIMKIVPTVNRQLPSDDDSCSDDSIEYSSDDDVCVEGTTAVSYESDVSPNLTDIGLSDINEGVPSEETVTVIDADINFQSSSDEDQKCFRG